LASLIYNSLFLDAFNGRINFSRDSFSCLLVGEEYVPNKRMHSRRSDISGEVIAAGYAPGGTTVAVTLAYDETHDRIALMLGSARWQDSTITAFGAVFCKRRGGLPSDDELVCFLDFGDGVQSINDYFSLSESELWIDNSILV
jgi:hypothetical protein